MSKGELLRKLANFHDEQEIVVILFSEKYPDGCQLLIQGVEPTSPWHDSVTKLAAIFVDEQNRGITNR